MASLPLQLADVLEQELVRLQGADPEASEPDPAQPPPPKRRWELASDDITNGRHLAAKLATLLARGELQRRRRWFERARRAAADDEELGPKVADQLSKWAKAGAPSGQPYRQQLADRVNVLLEKRRWLFDEPGFAELRRPPFDTLEGVDDFSPEGKAKDGWQDPDAVAILNRQIFDDFFRHEVRSAAESRLKDVVDRIHQRAAKEGLRTGLAISGGGIRSATFALGILQGLARKHILETFDFVSTVSGGGYIGSWLSSWARRDRWGIRGVAGLLASRPAAKVEPEPVPIQHLRAYSNYLTPRLGVLSADTWALIATYLRNLLLNWLVLVPLLVALVVAPRLLLSTLTLDPGADAASAAAIGGVAMLMLGLVFVVRERPLTSAKKRMQFTDGKFVLRCLLPLASAALLLVIAWAWFTESDGAPLPWWQPVAIAAAVNVVGWVCFVLQLYFTRSSQKVVDDRERTRRRDRFWSELVGTLLAGGLAGTLVWLAMRGFDTPVEAPRFEDLWAVRWPADDGGSLSTATAAYVTLALPAILGIFFLQATLFVGLVGKTNHDFDREWWARASGWVLVAALSWIVLCAVTIYGPIGIYYSPKLLAAAGGAAGAFSLLAGWSAKTKPRSASDDEESLGARVVSAALSLTVPLFAVLLLALVSLGTSYALRPLAGVVPPDPQQVARELRVADKAAREKMVIAARQDAKVAQKLVADMPRLRSRLHLEVLRDTAFSVAFYVLAGAIAIGSLASWCIGVNVFSMHAMYRNRLVRAYLGASRWLREANAFTGFDPNDNLFMHELRPEYLWAYSLNDLDGPLATLAGMARANRAEGGAKRVSRRTRPAAAMQPAGPPTRLEILYGKLYESLGDEIENTLRWTPGMPVDPALHQTLNTVIATADLVKTDPHDEPRRPLRNRRFVEQAFDDKIHPSPMPLLCAHDLRHEKTFVRQLVASRKAAPLRAALGLSGPEPPPPRAVLAKLNQLIVNGTGAFAPNLAASVVAPFRLGKDTAGNEIPLHPMIVNRLRIDQALAGLVAPLRPPRPLHLVNMCCNLASGDQLAWQQRKGESFTVSPLASGSFLLGYRDSRTYGGISLGTAVTISGAAASPNMGYHSSPALAFLMTLFNVRLGWWLGNPGLAGQTTYGDRNPRTSLGPLLREATGNTDDKYRYVYLSDGGHFENLGLYELVLRRCHRILVSDAGADPRYAYDDLGNAVRKIRVDLGIPVRVTHTGIIPPDQKKPGKYCAVGLIDYGEVDGKTDGNVHEAVAPGKFLYIKPVVYQEDVDLPRDVFNYARQSGDFPHESTADQWFSESQFESYRRLGAYTIEQICQAAQEPTRVDSVDELINAATRYLTPWIAPQA